MSLPAYTMGQTGLLDFSPIENALGRAIQNRQFQARNALDQQRIAMDERRLGMDEKRLGFEQSMQPERLALLRAQVEAQKAQAGMTPLQRQQLEAQIAQIRAQTEALGRKDAMDQIFLRSFGAGDQPAAPAPSPIRPQSYAPTPERPAIMTPATAGVAPPAPTGDPMLIRTQAAPGQPQAPADDPIIEIPGMGRMPRSQAQKLGMFLAYRGKGEAGKMIMEAARPGQLGKEARNEIDKNEINLTEQMARLREISRQFKPQYLTFEERGKQYGVSWLDSWDATRGKLTPEMITELSDFTTFRRNVKENLNRYIKEITGAAMGVQEAERIIAAQPNENDSPTQFQAKLKATIRAAELGIARTRYLRQNGFNGQPWNGNKEEAARVMPLEKMGDVIRQDFRSITEQIKAQNPQATEQQLNGAVRAIIRSRYGVDA